MKRWFQFLAAIAIGSLLPIELLGAAGLQDGIREAPSGTLSVRGRVIQNGNTTGLQVALTGNGPPLIVNVAPDGSFEFPVVRPGSYSAVILPQLGPAAGVPVVVSDKDISNLELVVPRGSVTSALVTVNVKVEGDGSVPQFLLQITPAIGAQPALPPPPRRGIQVSGAVSRQPVPLGEYRVMPPTGSIFAIPAGYVLKSIAAGPIDLLSQPLKINAGDTPEISVVLATAGVSNVASLQSSSVRVEGRAVSPPLRPGQTLRALLRPGAGAGALSAVAVGTDGSFAFTSIPSGNYLLSIAICESGACNSMGGMNISVSDKDVAGLVVSTQGAPGTTPAATPITSGSIEGTVQVEGNAALPAFLLRFTTGAVTRALAVRDKSFNASLPPGDYQVTVADLPAGYEVRSISDGSFDLRRWPVPVVSPSIMPNGGRRIHITLGLTNAR